jgi:Archaeal flagella assembly protein J
VFQVASLKVGLIDGYDYIALRLFGSLAPFFAKTFELDRSLRRAGLLVHPHLYAARVILAVLVSFLTAIYIAVIIVLSGSTFTVKVLALFLTILAPTLTLAIGLLYPSLKAEDRKRRVDSELPFLASYLSAMAIAGVDVMRALERVASLKVFYGVRREAQMILRDVRFLGRNPLDAIEGNAVDHPSSYYRDFMLGYSASVKIGGNVIGYLEAKTNDIFRGRIEDLKIMSERLALYTELYIILAVIASISFYTFFTVNVMSPGAGSAGLTQMLLFSFRLHAPLSATHTIPS